MSSRVRFTEDQLRDAVAGALSWAETLRRLDYCPGGGNPATIKKYVDLWGIDVSHFDPDAVRRRSLPRTGKPLQEILVRRSTYSRGLRKPRRRKRCEGCGTDFTPRFSKQKFCSRECGQRAGRIVGRGVAKPHLRRVDRPPHDRLVREIEETSYSAVGRRYGVSDNAVRKWVRFYEREAERRESEGDNRRGRASDEAGRA